MRTLLIFFISLLLYVSLNAQTIDTSELNKLQSGEYSIAEGQLQILFTDTTTEAFAFQELHKLGLQIKSSEFNNILLAVRNHPQKKQIQSIQEDDAVLLVFNEDSYINTPEDLTTIARTIMEQKVAPESVSEFVFKDEYEILMIMLNEKATMQDANRLIDKHPEVEFNTLFKARRSAVVQAESGKEDEIISTLESKPYIKSVAYMGVIE